MKKSIDSEEEDKSLNEILSMVQFLDPEILLLEYMTCSLEFGGKDKLFFKKLNLLLYRKISSNESHMELCEEMFHTEYIMALSDIFMDDDEDVLQLIEEMKNCIENNQLLEISSLVKKPWFRKKLNEDLKRKCITRFSIKINLMKSLYQDVKHEEDRMIKYPDSDGLMFRHQIVSVITPAAQFSALCFAMSIEPDFVLLLG